MVATAVRQIVKIDEEKCDGCGLCVPGCVEGALKIIDGKARLISEIYCDGLGACLGECPQGAITIEERLADGFDEEATKLHMEEQEAAEETLACGCPGSSVTQLEMQEATEVAPGERIDQPSTLSHWPVKLTLVPATAPFLQGTDLLLTADCVPFAYPDFHRDLLKDHSLLIACPKLDDYQAHLKKLTAVLSQSDVKSLTVVHMEVPCCFGLVRMAEQAIELSEKDIPFEEITVGVKGDLEY